MDITAEHFLKSKKLLNVNLRNLLEVAEKRNIESELVLRALDSYQDRNSILASLRLLGFSLQELADLLNVTRERIRQLTAPNLRANEPYSRERSLREIEILIIAQASHDVTWWTKKRGIKLSKLKAIFRKSGWNVNESPWRQLDLRKARVLLEGTMGVPKDEHRRWIMEQRQRGYQQNEICQMINQQTRVPLSHMTWNRYISDLGIRENIR